MTNRQLQIVAGPDNAMLVDDTATDWEDDGADDRRGVQAWRDPLVAVTEPAPGSNGPVASVYAEFTVLVTAADPKEVITVTDSAGSIVRGTVVEEGGAPLSSRPTSRWPQATIRPPCSTLQRIRL
jgi:hypothetical protein